MAVILVTGCGSGLGAALVPRLAAQGHDVIATARSLAGLSRSFADKSCAGSIYCAQMDVTDSIDVVDVIQRFETLLTRVDAVILNAGSYAPGTIESADEQQARRSFDVNYWGAVNVVRAVLPVMRQQGAGKIIGIGSVSAAVGLPCDGYYAAAKAAMERMLESLRYEVAAFGIDVSVVAPSSFRSGLLAQSAGVERRGPYAPLLAHWLRGVEASTDNEGVSVREVVEVLVDIIAEAEPQFLYPVGPVADKVLGVLNAMSDRQRASAIVDWSDTAWWLADKPGRRQ